MATKWVRTDGNDANDGSDNDAAHAWLTINKALMGPSGAAAGDTVKVGNGTYAENSSGLGYLYLYPSFASEVVVESASGNADDVIITHTGTAQMMSMGVAGGGPCRNVHFKNVTFQHSATANDAGNNNLINISYGRSVTFTGCKFKARPGNSAARYVVSITDTSWVTPLAAAGPISFIGCTLEQLSFKTVYQRGLSAATTNMQMLGLTVSGCTFSLTGIGLYALNVTGLAVTDNTFTITYESAVSIGAETSVATTIDGEVSGNKITSVGSHGLLIGYGADTVAVDDNQIKGGDIGLVLKGCVDVDCDGNVVENGTTVAVTFKAATNTTVTNSVILQSDDAYAAVMLQEDGAAKCSGCEFTDNRVIVALGASIYSIGEAAADDGGSVFDRNQYWLAGTGNLGTVKGTAGITTLAGLQAAWSAYGDGSNEANSELVGGLPLASIVRKGRTFDGGTKTGTFGGSRGVMHIGG